VCLTFFAVINHDKLKFGDWCSWTLCRSGQAEGAEWKALIDAGINDWGGISPVTKDWVNPEVRDPLNMSNAIKLEYT
jgi:hypothetical protein